MPYADQEYPGHETAVAWRVVTRAADYTVICKQEDLMRYQREYIAKQRAQGVPLQDILFIWDRTYIVPLAGVR